MKGRFLVVFMKVHWIWVCFSNPMGGLNMGLIFLFFANELFLFLLIKFCYHFKQENLSSKPISRSLKFLKRCGRISYGME